MLSAPLSAAPSAQRDSGRQLPASLRFGGMRVDIEIAAKHDCIPSKRSHAQLICRSQSDDHVIDGSAQRARHGRSVAETHNEIGPALTDSQIRGELPT
jgi:hypothetical protein